MQDIHYIIENQATVEANVTARGVKSDISGLIAVYEKLKSAKQELEGLQAQSNKIAKDIPTADDKATLVAEGKAVKEKIKDISDTVTTLDEQYKELMLTVPNGLAEGTPEGLEDDSNVPIKHFMEPTKFEFTPKDHLELGTDLDLIDFEGGAKVAGNKFYFLKNDAVLLDMALQQFAMNKAVAAGYTPLLTPDLARNSILEGVGFAPRGDESNTYALEDQDMSLIATAEIAVGGLHSKEVFTEEQLPLRYAAFSHCFRREAGAGGQSSKGLYRVHQFGKVELFAFTKPDQSEAVHDEILAIEEDIYQELKIPYQVVRICAGDLGAPAYKKYDIEAWMPGKGEEGEYGEVTSASNCTEFQSRRLGVKYADKASGRNEFVHTLNGTAIALSRAMVAILENYQNADGSVTIPEAIQPFMSGKKAIQALSADGVVAKKSA